MIKIVDFEITLGSSATNLATALALAEGNHATRVIIEPDSGNTHVVKIQGPNAKTIKQLAKPTASDAVLDNFTWDVTEGADLIDLAQLSILGTSGEKVHGAAFIG